MIDALICWWHRAVLWHPQVPVMNGETEPGVRCYCWTKWIMRRIYRDLGLTVPNSPLNRYRWFPSDGGHGR